MCGGVDSIGAEGDPREHPGPGRFAPEVRVPAAGLLGHIHVADPRAVDFRLREHLVDRHRRIHRDDGGRFHLAHREHRKEFVPTDELALLVHRDHPISVPVVRDSEIGLRGPDAPPEEFEVFLRGLRVPRREPPVRLDVQGGDLTAHLPQDRGRDRRCRPGAAVHDDLEVRIADDGENRLLVEFLKVRARVAGADLIPSRVTRGFPLERRFDFFLLRLIERNPVRVPQFDPVVGSRVVGGGNHRTALVRLRATGERRGADHSRIRGVGAGSEDAGNQGEGKHLPRQAGIAADNRGPVRVPEDPAHGLCQIGSDIDIRDPANPRGTEEPHGGSTLRALKILPHRRAKVLLATEDACSSESLYTDARIRGHPPERRARRDFPR